MYPMYDSCTSTCYVAGKGDSLMRAYEISLMSDESDSGEKTLAAMCDRAAEFAPSLDRSTFTGVCMLPIRLCNVRDIECARILKLTNTAVVPASVKLARAEHMRAYFQDDIYGSVRSATQHHTAEDFRNWLTEPDIFIGPSEESIQPSDMMRLSDKPAEAPKTSRVSSFRAAKEQEEREVGTAECVRVCDNVMCCGACCVMRLYDIYSNFFPSFFTRTRSCERRKTRCGA